MTRLNGNKCFPKESHEVDAYGTTKKARIFVALTLMAMVLMSPISSSPTRGVFDNLKDIWNSPGRLTAIEADINRINESLAMYTEDGDRAITLLDQ